MIIFNILHGLKFSQGSNSSDNSTCEILCRVVLLDMYVICMLYGCAYKPYPDATGMLNLRYSFRHVKMICLFLSS
uniref:Uncharacterized protein n=1 Tax=Arundo donax TaxID=35708 RepID=A0A0A8ZD17_ARUDO